MELSPALLDDETRPWADPAAYWPALSRAVTARTGAGPGYPLATLDLTALEHNAADLRRRAGGIPIRVASKSVRCRPVVEALLRQEGYAGVLAYSLAEAVWAAGWCDDVLMGYPSTDRAALAELLTDEQACGRVTLMVDSVVHLDLVDAVAQPDARPEVRVAIDLDLAYEPPVASRLTGRVGVYRSPVATAEQARVLAQAVVARRGFRLVGVMGYEAQIAGVGDASPEPVTPEPGLLPRARSAAARTQAATARARALVLRRLQADSWVDVLERRSAMVAAIREVADAAGGRHGLEVVNGGGTGSVHLTRHDPSITEVAAGSGLFGPTLFDRYRSFAPAPAAAFALPVVRRPAGDIATVAGGGWVASGPAGADRVPSVVWPGEVELLANEGTGEVQTPLRGPGARGLAVGELTWWRHAKAGELAEHVAELTLVRTARSGGVTADVEGSVPTYRGEGKAFG